MTEANITGTDGADSGTRIERAAIGMLATWMSERYFRTFRLGTEDERGPFDATLTQRANRVGVTVGRLWERGDDAAAGLEALVSADLAADGDLGGYVLWAPPGVAMPSSEPAISEVRDLVRRGLHGLATGERRELRVPALLRLAKIDGAGAYVSVSGGLASEWTFMSEGISGAFHLDSREIHRLPEEQAEREILISQVRDRAALLEVAEISAIEAHDTWLVSRLPDDQPSGLTVIGAGHDFDGGDAAAMRRVMRRHVSRAEEQRFSGNCNLSALLLVGALAHLDDERVTAALRGMNPTAYGALDLVALVGDGQVRQVLQPRQLPWGT